MGHPGLDINRIAEHGDDQQCQRPGTSRQDIKAITADDEAACAEHPGDTDTGGVELEDQQCGADQEQQVGHRRTGERVHPTVEERQLREAHRRDRHAHGFIAARVDLGGKAGQIEGEEGEGWRVPVGETEGDDGLLVDGVLAQGLGDLDERRHQQRLGDDEFARLAELGTDGDADFVGCRDQLCDRSSGIGTGRPDPGVDRHLGRADLLGEFDQTLVGDDRPSAVDLKNQAAAAAGFGVVDRRLDEVGHDAVDEPGDLHHVENEWLVGRILRLVLGPSGAHGGQCPDEERHEGDR